MGELKFVFVHWLSGWGSYDKTYSRMPYWGMRTGDLISYLREKGFDCHAASVSHYYKVGSFLPALLQINSKYNHSHSTVACPMLQRHHIR